MNMQQQDTIDYFHNRKESCEQAAADLTIVSPGAQAGNMVGCKGENHIRCLLLVSRD